MDEFQDPELQFTRAAPRRLDIVDRLALAISQIFVALMAVLYCAEIVVRDGFGWSFGFVDDLGGYLLVAVFLMSIGAAGRYGSFHTVELVQGRLSQRGRLVSQVIFDVMSLVMAAVLLWQLGRFELLSWRSQELALDLTRTPLWIPRLAMVIGTLTFLYSIVRMFFEDLGRLWTMRAAPSS